MISRGQARPQFATASATAIAARSGQPGRAKRTSRFWRRQQITLRSHVVEDAVICPEFLGLNAGLLEHADKQVAQRGIVFEVFDDMTLMLVAAAGKDDREILAVVDVPPVVMPSVMLGIG